MNREALLKIAELSEKLSLRQMRSFETCAVGEGQKAKLIQNSGLGMGCKDAAASLGIPESVARILFSPFQTGEECAANIRSLVGDCREMG